jgi:hypothetical protein
MGAAQASDHRPGWSTQVSKVILALARYRLSLRRAAMRAGDPGFSVRLRRLAMRRRADVEELTRHAPLPEPTDSPEEPDLLGGLRRDDRTANEIASLAACLRSNRKLRIALERADPAQPPARVATRLDRLRDEVEREYGILNGRLRDIAVAGVPPSPLDTK